MQLFEYDHFKADFVNRVIYYGGEFNTNLAVSFTQAFHKLQENEWPITIICTGSDGGNWDECGLSLVDLVYNSKNYITFYGLGSQTSCQALLFLAADYRFLAPNGYLLIHDGSMTLEEEPLREIENMAEVLKKMRNRDYEFLSERSVRPPSYWAEKLSRDHIIFAEEALELGLIEEIGTP